MEGANRNLANTAYTYDAENRLVVASTGAQLTYEPLGRLYESYSPGTGITRFIYDGDNLVAEYDGSRTLLRRNAFGPDIDEPILLDEGNALNCSGTKVLHADPQGSVLAQADCWGNRTAINSYHEYGIPAAGNAGRFQYIGQAWILALGLEPQPIGRPLGCCPDRGRHDQEYSEDLEDLGGGPEANESTLCVEIAGVQGLSSLFGKAAVIG